MNKPEHYKQGFTLVEVMLATALSVFVFLAMGTLLVQITRLWCDGAGQFHLASRARAVRARLLNGESGLLSVSQIDSLKTNPQWCTLTYKAVSRDEKFTLCGSVDGNSPADTSLYLKTSKGGKDTDLAMLGTKRGRKNSQDVTVVWFDVNQTNLTWDASRSNRLLNVQYRLIFDAAGRPIPYPQTVNAYLVNR